MSVSISTPGNAATCWWLQSQFIRCICGDITTLKNNFQYDIPHQSALHFEVIIADEERPASAYYVREKR
jgi:hypothetical protein